MAQRKLPRVERQCKWCGATFIARQKDVDRGYGNYCSRDCKMHGMRAAHLAKGYPKGPDHPLWRGGTQSPRQLAYARAQRELNPDKLRAREAVHAELRAGRLFRGDCQAAGEHRGRVQAHHPDYAKPLEIVWLCTRHHSLEHKDARPRGNQHWRKRDKAAGVNGESTKR